MKTITTTLVQSVTGWLTDTSTPPPVRLLSILVVDDEESIRRFVSRVLDVAGYETTLCADGADAIATARGRRFDLLLTDVVMPEMTGAALAARLREDDPGLRVLYLTGFCDRLFDEKRALDHNEAFLEKPFSPLGLREAVSLAITGRVPSGPASPVPAASRPAGHHSAAPAAKDQE